MKLVVFTILLFVCQISAILELLPTICDFIIVGSGTAGSVVANQLAIENSNWKVCVLEQGGDPTVNNPNISIPFMLYALQENKNVTKSYSSDPLSQVGGLVVENPRGIGLGGSSLINGMTVQRAPKFDFDLYTSLGLNGWTYGDVLPYYLKIENNTQLGPSEGHSKNGPMTMQMDTIDDIIINTFEEAAVELGFTDDYYNDWSHVNATGIVRNYVAIKNGERESSRTTYLDQTPSNLKIYTNFHVDNIIIFPIFGKRIAAGVVGRNKDGDLKLFFSLKETIISAGTIQTPEILMRSGIGNKTHLEEQNITSLKDLPGVGENLQDHYGILSLRIKEQDSPFADPDFVNQQWEQYMYNRTGYFSWPFFDHNILLTDTPIGEHNPNDISVTTGLGSLPGLEAFLAHAIVLSQPKSRGRVYLNLTDETNPLHIDLGYFTDPEDFEKILYGLNISRQLFDANAYNGVVGSYAIPDETFNELQIKQLAFTSYHLCCTAKMGIPTDPMAVVNDKFQVFGIDRLSVIDMSVLPVMPTANPYYTALMLGKRGADFIKSRYL